MFAEDGPQCRKVWVRGTWAVLSCMACTRQVSKAKNSSLLSSKTHFQPLLPTPILFMKALWVGEFVTTQPISLRFFKRRIFFFLTFRISKANPKISYNKLREAVVYYLIILPIFFWHSSGSTWPLVLQWWETAVFLLKHPNPFLAVFKPAALKTWNFLFPVTVVLEDPFKEESGKGREDGAPASTPRPSLALALVPLSISKTSFPATAI